MNRYKNIIISITVGISLAIVSTFFSVTVNEYRHWDYPFWIYAVEFVAVATCCTLKLNQMIKEEEEDGK